MYPEIPEDREALSAEELRALALEVRKAALADVRARGADAMSDVTAAREAAALLDTEAELAESTTEVAADPDEADADDDAADDADADDAEASTVAGATITELTVHTDVSVADVNPGGQVATVTPIRPDAIFKVDPDTDTARAAAFDDWGEFGMAAVEMAKTIDSGSSRRYEVGRILGNYPAERTLTDSAIDNLAKLDTLGMFAGKSVEEITAACCAPPTQDYSIGGLNTTRRPVSNALRRYAAPRGAVSLFPCLSTDMTSPGIWTCVEDDDPEAVKNECDTIDCIDPEPFKMYGVYWCLTVKNMLQLTFPELVAAYLNRGAAAFVSLAETQLLDAMGARAATINATPALGYGATLRISTQILQYLALYREIQRWDDVPMEAWMPRWLQAALRIDLSRRRRDGQWRIASIAEVNQAFTDVGVVPHWYLDSPAWGTPPPASIATGGNPSIGLLGDLSALPTEADILVNPVGKYAMIDRAQLSIGVTGNNWYRDNVSNSKNELTFFFENYEGVVDTGCDAHILHFEDLCYNGAVIADVAIDCDGEAAA